MRGRGSCAEHDEEASLAMVAVEWSRGVMREEWY